MPVALTTTEYVAAAGGGGGGGPPDEPPPPPQPAITRITALNPIATRRDLRRLRIAVPTNKSDAATMASPAAGPPSKGSPAGATVGVPASADAVIISVGFAKPFSAVVAGTLHVRFVDEVEHVIVTFPLKLLADASPIGMLVEEPGCSVISDALGVIVKLPTICVAVTVAVLLVDGR